MKAVHVYRPDVDGLRAVAVLAVLAFHAFPEALPSGFAGVDVFFVISGFLISGIIFDGLRQGSFSFAEFYWRRIRRIFPALILVLAACLVLGWLVLLPDEYRQLGKHVAAGAGFISNGVLWREAGYFDTAGEFKPLLHLWSLAIEEQYYLVWPLLLFLFRTQPRRMLAMILAVGAVSFAANIWMTARTESAAFYLPFTRFWELMAGSVLAHALHYRERRETFSNAKAAVGVALLAASLVLLHGERSFPGWWALLPVLGTVLLIAAGPGAWINRNILARPTMVFIGLISYPLYLWHWPLLSYARILEGGQAPAAVRLALLGLSVLLAWLTYALIERKVRFATRPSLKRIATPALAASLAALGLAGLLAVQGRLEPQSASVPLLAEISRAASDWDYGGDRMIPGDTDKAVLFFGDSHMQHYGPRIHKIVAERAAPVRSVIFKTSNGCAPVPGIERPFRNCSRFVEEGLRVALQPQVDTVIIAASWLGFTHRPVYRVGDVSGALLDVLAPENAWVLEGFEAALHKLVHNGKRVVLVLSSPRGAAFNPKSFMRREGMTMEVSEQVAAVPRGEATERTTAVDARLKAIATAVGAAIIDPADWLCTPSHCPTADEFGRPLFIDTSHLRASVARERFLAVDRYVYLK
jgi:peptidoglycan/LPS O-acetylase OafA/YrhL